MEAIILENIWQRNLIWHIIILLINFSGQSANKESLRFRKMLIHSLECVQKNWKKGAAASFLFFKNLQNL